MGIEKVSIKDLVLNPNNPRIIKDDKFKKLVKSIKEFPEMLEVRPIVVDDEMVVLGGNMRTKACIEAGLKEVSIIKFSNLSEEKKKEFIVKDNVGYGEWDFDMLTHEWDIDDLTEWGLEITIDNYEKLNPDELEDDFYISDEDRKPIQQMTFVLSTEQVELIEECLSSMMKTDEYKYMESFGNENSRGNALYKILETWKNKK